MSEKHIVEQLADFYSRLALPSIPDEVVTKARMSLVDFIGVLVTGYREGILPRIVDDYLQGRHGRHESTWLSRGVRTPATDAAFSMGVAAHAVELDDGHRFGTAHPAVVVIPAALSVGEREHRPFTELLRAIIIGYDVMLRLATSINPSHLRRGYHTTSTCGVIGASFACATLLNLDATRTAHAASIAALQSAGLQEMLHDNPAIKPLQPGRAAANGVLAADLACRGARGPRSALEGTHGWLKAVTDEFRREDLLGDLGTSFEIMRTYTKPYPTCRHCHASIDLAIEARHEISFSVESIERITVRTYDAAVAEVAEIRNPRNYDEAMFSLPFSIALALKQGTVTLTDYSERNFRDHGLNQIQQKIYIQSDEQMNALYPDERGASVRIEARSGDVWEKRVALPRGEPETPLSKEELRLKLAQCVNPYYPRDVADSVWASCVERDAERVSYEEILRIFDTRSLG